MQMCRLVSYKTSIWLGLMIGTAGIACADAVDVAATFIGKPYHSACKDPNGTGVSYDGTGKDNQCNGGLDCTGLVQYAYGQVGVTLPPQLQYLDPKVTRITDQRCAQAATCTLQELISYGILQRGDLLWFDTRSAADGYDPNNKVTWHVGIYESGTTMIDAFNEYWNIRRDDLLVGQKPVGLNYWTDRFMFAGRVASGSSSYQWLSFSEGIPGVPGDGQVINAGPDIYHIWGSPLFAFFNPSPPTSLAGVTNGFTLTVYPRNGPPVTPSSLALQIRPIHPPAGCPVIGWGIEKNEVGTVSTVTFKGVTGYAISVPQTSLQRDLDLVNQSLSQSNPTCHYQFSDMYIIDMVFSSTFDNNISNYVTQLDAAAFALGQNVIP